MIKFENKKVCFPFRNLTNNEISFDDFKTKFFKLNKIVKTGLRIVILNFL